MALLRVQDYSKNTYDQAWSRDCWCASACRLRVLPPCPVLDRDLKWDPCRWNKPVLVYGDDKLRKDHPVVAFLAREKRCASLGIYKAGCAAQQFCPAVGIARHLLYDSTVGTTSSDGLCASEASSRHARLWPVVLPQGI